MKIITDINSMQAECLDYKATGLTVGFVPTMGNLHEGHISLVRRAVEENDRVVVSIFVNPLQFNDQNDFDAYPRTLEEDLKLLEKDQVDIAFVPEERTLYPDGRDGMSIVDVQKLAHKLEGKFRPGHFAGVTTVVSKFFNIVQPSVAYFGEKDFQQLLIIQRMVKDLNIPVKIESMPTLRESDGLAMSSRNRKLSDQQRRVAPELYAVLKITREKIMAGGAAIASLESQAIDSLNSTGFNTEYFTIRNCHDLSEPKSGQPLIILAAAWLGSTRLIDNLKI